jgi:mono/diheme cytochrome c family protein
MRKWLTWLGALTLVGVVAGSATLTVFLRRGISARAKPWAVEAWTARGLRHLAIPSGERARPNPVPRTKEAVAQGRAHFADHCAVCHGNDGRGDTDFGRGLYPPPPDLRGAATQELSDGEIFWIIRNGIRFTGMPGFGTEPADSDEETWHLVHFIRHLPDLSPDELEKMKTLNPLSRKELEEERRIERFLAGEDPPAQGGAHDGHEHSQGGG